MKKNENSTKKTEEKTGRFTMNQSIHQHFLYIKELNLFGKKPESSCTCREAEGEAEGADCPQPTVRAVCFDPLPATLSGEKILCKGRRGN